MPDLKERFALEAKFQSALQRGWASYAAGSRYSEAGLASSVSVAVQPVLEEVHQRALIQVILLWSSEDSDVGAKWGDVESNGDQALGLARIAGRASRNQANRFGREFGKSTSDWRDSWNGDGSRIDWEKSTIYAPSRAERAAITEVTTGISDSESNGAEIIKSVGVLAVPIWETRKDVKVCPICEPFDGMGEEVWGIEFPDGPPAHPRCRCRKRYKLIKIKRRR